MRRWMAAALLALPVGAQSPYVHFESAPTHPLRVSADGTRLFACNGSDNRLEVYSLADVDRPVLVRDIPVGLEPVSVAARTSDEVWVVNSLSDSVSVVSIAQGRVVATLRVADEPADVAFAAGRAFVTAMASDEVHVFDAATRVFVAKIAIQANDPAALATVGDRVYVLSKRSGNDTTIVPYDKAPPPPPPTNQSLPPAPQQGVIVAEDDPSWSSVVTWSVRDDDLFEIDATTLAVVRKFARVGTNNFDLVADPSTGRLYVANTDARNLVRFEPSLRGHAIESRITRVTTGATPTTSHWNLNPGVNYAVLPNASALATALAEPTGLALDPVAGRLYVAAQGTDRVGVLDLAGNVLARIEVGDTPGPEIDTRQKRGPRALALHPTSPRLYVLQRLSAGLAVIDTQSSSIVREQPLAHDPIPASIGVGRRFLYDAKLSGNGTFSCAACHVDGDVDGLAWDLGDPGGQMIPPPPNQPGATDMHPMKGPMTTQTLRGLQVAPFHWRGDRADLPAFNVAFDRLLGGSQLDATGIALLSSFLQATRFPPNPNQNLDRSLKTTPPNANQAAGKVAFQQLIGGGGSCESCHAAPAGTGGVIIPANLLQQPQQMKTAHLRNLYRKVGMPQGASSGKLGFGFLHDGSLPNLTAFLAQPVFDPWPAATKDDLVEFLLGFDTGQAPTVGYQSTVTQANASSSAVASDATLLQSQAVSNCDLIAKGVLNGKPRGLVYDPAQARFTSDASGIGPFTWNDLRNQALAGLASWTLTGVPRLSGTRIGVDRDLDGVLDGNEGVIELGGAVAGCSGAIRFEANGEPAVGNELFAAVASNLQPFAQGRVVLSPGNGNDPFAIGHVLLGQTLAADAHGFAFAHRPIPDDGALAGNVLWAQAIFHDPCAANGLARSQRLRITIQP